MDSARSAESKASIKKLSPLDRLIEGVSSQHEFLAAMKDEIHAGLSVYCDIPAGYQHCTLQTRNVDIEKLSEEQVRDLIDRPQGEIVNPENAHREAIEFFAMIQEGHPLVTKDGNPLRPTVGAYLQGPTGVAKTHIMAAYGRWAQQKLAQELKEIMTRVDSLIGTFYRQYTYDIDHVKQGDGLKTRSFELTASDIKDPEKTPQEKLRQGIEGAKRILAGSKYQPNDMLYLGFEDLCTLYGSKETRSDALEAIEQAPIIFVDDVHAQGTEGGLDVVKKLFERRYELKQFGTFVTSNVDVESIGGSDANVAKRILSRSKESSLVIDFAGCTDWRESMKQRKIQFIRDEISKRIAARSQIA